MTTRYKKVYKGPFILEEATTLAKEIGGQVRKRRNGKCVCTAACGAGVGHNSMYDVYKK